MESERESSKGDVGVSGSHQRKATKDRHCGVRLDDFELFPPRNVTTHVWGHCHTCSGDATQLMALGSVIKPTSTALKDGKRGA